MTFTITADDGTFGACHCEMCRRWTGSMFLGMGVREADLVITNAERVRTRQTSEWAERAWCDACGSGLWYRITREGRLGGRYDIPIGLLDEPDGLVFAREVFIDDKPDGYAFEGNHRLLTRKQVERLFRVSLERRDP